MLSSQRLLFRRYDNNDFPFLMSLLSDPAVIQFIGNGKPRDENEGKKFLSWIYRTYESNKNMGLMVLVNKADNTLIGHAGLVPQTIDSKEEIEIGYWISREHWGKGYATEAAHTLLEHGTKHLQHERFIALIQPDNFASQHVAQKIGMSLDKKLVLNGQDVHVYSKYT
ncbi:GNAT family N-acetyltransferase [Virgibacillus salarius]|uniref:GNAT family N-acetyltransferase n=1 Tax=Virgibacillus salarius TaxID=447199 RepID=UPI00047932FB|nr:GNAT family N-acetyltransferase [Priestia megaterium]